MTVYKTGASYLPFLEGGLLLRFYCVIEMCKFIHICSLISIIQNVAITLSDTNKSYVCKLFVFQYNGDHLVNTYNKVVDCMLAWICSTSVLLVIRVVIKGMYVYLWVSLHLIYCILGLRSGRTPFTYIVVALIFLKYHIICRKCTPSFFLFHSTCLQWHLLVIADSMWSFAEKNLLGT